MRMRHRRAERCLLRAEAALEAGFEDEAQAAVEEARRLTSDSPDFETVRGHVLARRAAADTARRASSRRRILAGSLAVVVLAGGLYAAASALARRESASGTSSVTPGPESRTAAASPAASLRRESTAAVVTTGTAAAPPSDDVTPPISPEKTVTRPADTPPKVERQVPADVSRPSPAAMPPPAEAEPRPPATTGRVGPTPPVQPGSDTPARPEPSTAPAAVLAAEQVATPEVLGTASLNLPTEPVAAPPPPPPAPVAESRPAPPPPSEESRVRAVLNQFEMAFSTLSASSAAIIWPTVDQRALGRAFGSLESQQVSLGNCTVSVNGPRANANCTGHARWTPKVGGSTRTEARHWTFDLVNRGSDWKIDSVVVR